ncbi:MAG: L,D-transpeptidase family protein [Candidatus Pacebacteria bacterium]|nr:L,D-transpeptidase family protein [Candidatus Paceibacterota bacterium]
MKDFWHYAFWVGLTAVFAISLFNLVPVAARVGMDFMTGNWASQLHYQVATAAATVSSPVLRSTVNDPVFTPPTRGKAIRADLAAMKLSLYEDGNNIATYDIVAKGKPGSPWETPTGEYHVLLKKESHFSSLGEVWMPWSLQFFGNFFIHGRPYDETGKELPDGYSGGCIRLATADAEMVYNFATSDTLVSVYGGKNEGVGTNSYELLSQTLPKVSAAAYAVVDLETGEVILEHNLDQVYPIASLSKLLTAIVSLEIIDQSDLVNISKVAIDTYGTQGNLRLGENLPAQELLYPLLLESSNDAAEAIARHFGRAEFIRALNNKASAIGLTDTHFDDPSGLSPKNVSSARDLAKLSRYIYQSKRYIFDLTRRGAYDYANHHWVNSNKLVKQENYLGGKNGFIDEARQTQIALFELPLGEFSKRPVALVVLRSANREADIKTLVEFIDTHTVFSETPKNPTFQYL